MACKCPICTSYEAISAELKYFCLPQLKPEEDHLSPKFKWEPDVSKAKESKYGL